MMAGMCIYEPLNGSFPNCDGICKREDACCGYYYEYEKQYEKEPLQPVWKTECMNKKADVVEIVRCKYCVLRFTNKCPLHDQAFPINKGGNWFCGDGKRRVDDG